MTLNEAIEQIENALFDESEPGCCDTEWGELVINSIGRIRLERILRKFRNDAKQRKK